MEVNIKLWKVVVGVLLVVGGLSLYFGIKYHRNIERLSNELISLQEQLEDTLSTYEITFNGQSQLIAEQKSVILSYREAIRSHVLDKERLKRLHIASVRENVRLKSTISVLKDSLEMIKPEIIYVVDTATMDSIPHLRLPHSLSYEDDYMFLGVDIFKDNWYFNMAMDMDLELTIGEKKTGLFGREPVAFVGWDNPYMGSVRVQSLQVKREPMFYETTLFKVLTHVAALGTGFVLGGR
jgi:hypothetical protein